MNVLYNTLKWGGTKDYFMQVKVPGTAPYWKAWISGSARNHLELLVILTTIGVMMILCYFRLAVVRHLLSQEGLKDTMIEELFLELLHIYLNNFKR
jgi:hypothetical protein